MGQHAGASNNRVAFFIRAKHIMILGKRPISGLCVQSAGIPEYGDLGGNKNTADFDRKQVVSARGKSQRYPRAYSHFALVPNDHAELRV